MDPKQLAKEYLQDINVVQLATAENNEPWICTVHFYADDELNIYWVSRTDRKHSKQIVANPQASMTAVIHENTPEENYVISVTVSGKAEIVADPPADLREAYMSKLNKKPNQVPNADDPNDLQEFYCLKPSSIILFDTKDFPESPRQEITL